MTGLLSIFQSRSEACLLSLCIEMANKTCLLPKTLMGWMRFGLMSDWEHHCFDFMSPKLAPWRGSLHKSTLKGLLCCCALCAAVHSALLYVCAAVLRHARLL